VKLFKKSKGVYYLIQETKNGDLAGIGTILDGEIRIHTELRNRIFMEINSGDAKELLLWEAFEVLGLTEVIIDYKKITRKDWLNERKTTEVETKQKYKKLMKALKGG
jgi:hypothetical protein